MKIRTYQPRDAEGVARVYRRSVQELGPRHYTVEQVAAWASCAPDAAAFHARASDGRTFIVATDDADQVIAFIDLEADGHIDVLYASPEAAGRGFAWLLCATAEEIARAGGMTRLYSEVSEGALPLFLRRGFTRLHRRDLKIGNVAIHNYAVEKALG